MGFYDEAVYVLETIAKALNGAFSYGSMAGFYNRSWEKAPICPKFSKTAVRMKKHIRPPVRAEPETALACFTVKMPGLPLKRCRYPGFCRLICRE